MGEGIVAAHAALIAKVRSCLLGNTQRRHALDGDVRRGAVKMLGVRRAAHGTAQHHHPGPHDYGMLPEPEKALSELKRVTKPGGTIIIPTYINKSKRTGTFAVKFIEILGANFKRQLKSLGFSFDWSRQVDTTDPSYYKCGSPSS